MKSIFRTALLISLIFSTFLAFASTTYLAVPDSLKVPNDWFHMDPEKDGITGTGADRAHALLEGKTPKRTVIVAVIDSGVDIEHEDLQGKIWVNTGEIPGNGIDDDKNGYIDDVNGWNFIGGPDGSHVGPDSYELTREYVRLKPQYDDIDSGKIKKKQMAEFEYWKKIKADFEKSKEEAASRYSFYESLYDNFSEAAGLLKEIAGKVDVFPADLDEIEIDDENDEAMNAIGMISMLFANIGQDDLGINEVLGQLEEVVDYYKNQVDFTYNVDFDPRHIVGDDPENYKDRNYGNNDVKGPDSSHGTHVSGIIAARRDNDIGIRGIAEHVLIMPVRAVPDGDERDKDIANAIYYAVDNGAHIINMSFGKSYSPGKEHVDKAVKYAEKKGLLMVHAAGNSSKEVNETNNYPNRWFAKKGKASHWLEIGANYWQADTSLASGFSNYSARGVDFFSPGEGIYSTLPENEYGINSGTSMAAPAVSGVAALIMAYYPELKPQQVIEILQKSVYKPEGLEVNKPGPLGNKLPFSSLSIIGGVVNAYKALILAEEMTQ